MATQGRGNGIGVGMGGGMGMMDPDEMSQMSPMGVQGVQGAGASARKFLKIDGKPKISELWELAGVTRPKINPKTFLVGDPAHDRLVKDWDECDRYYLQMAQPYYEEVLDNYDLYLAQAPDERAPDELWRANIFVPLPFSNLETRNASLTNIITRADPMVQLEGVTDDDRETGRDIELVLDLTYRMNAFRRFFMLHQRAVGIQGTDFIKPVWVERAHNVRMFYSQQQKKDFMDRIREAVANGAPDPFMPMGPGGKTADPQIDPKAFEEWRLLVNKTKRTSMPIPEFPQDGPKQIVTYRGPELQRLPLGSVHLDPLVDDIAHQDRVFFRTLVPIQWVLERTGDEPDKPFLPSQVEQALWGWDGEDLDRYEREVNDKLGLNTQDRKYQDPFWGQAVELVEVYTLDPASEVKFGVMMNRKAIINKDPMEFPTWSGDCLITGIHNVQVPGKFYGISEFKEPRSLYEELRQFRNLRQDEATLRTLGVWTKLKEAGIPDAMFKITPGAIMQVQRHDALQMMQKGSMPPEAYREPQEIKAEIADSHGIWDSTKGAPATVGRVTGVEFSGRAEQAQLRLLMGAACYEEEMQAVNRQMISMWAQNGQEVLRLSYGGRILAIPRERLIEAITMQFRFRGVTQAIDRNLQAQQLMMVAERFGQTMTPAASFRLLRLILETLNIRGLESVITPEDEQQKIAEYSAQAGAATAAAGAQSDAAAAAGVDTSKVGASGGQPAGPGQPGPGGQGGEGQPAPGQPPAGGAPQAPAGA